MPQDGHANREGVSMRVGRSCTAIMPCSIGRYVNGRGLGRLAGLVDGLMVWAVDVDPAG